MVASFGVGLAVAAMTAPVGVSGAVFLLPVQISVLSVPSPAVTPTNLLFNVISVPGALLRYSRRNSLRSTLTRLLLAGALPGVIGGAVIRVYLVPAAATFKVIAAVLLMTLGVWLCLTTATGVVGERERPSRRMITATALAVGVVGGIYGIGGGSLLSPILAGRGVPLAEVAPAALTSTLLTSIVGAGTYAVLAATTGGVDIAPDWVIGFSCGTGGLVGGFLGAHLQPVAPERALRYLLAGLAVATAAVYVVQSL